MTAHPRFEPLFHACYGAALASVPEPVRQLHAMTEGRRLRGEVSVRRGMGMIACLVCRLLAIPESSSRLPVLLIMQRTPRGETWSRRFGTLSLVHTVGAGPRPGTLDHRLGTLRARVAVEVDGEGVSHRLIGLAVLGVPVPRALWPQLELREGARDGRYTFRAVVRLPAWYMAGPLLAQAEGSVSLAVPLAEPE